MESPKSGHVHLGQKPLIVISAGRSFTSQECQAQGISEDWIERFDEARHILQKNLMTKSSNSKQIIAESSGHRVTCEQPQVVIDAIHEMLSK